MKKFLILILLLTACGNTEPVDSESDTESKPICGNYILEGPEECDEDEECHDCIYDRRIFVSTLEQTGFLSDIYCKHNAEVNGLYRGLDWISWTSTSEENIKDLIYNSPSNYILVDGTLIAKNFNDLIDGELLAPINLDQFGNKIEDDLVWTGTNKQGEYTGYNCFDWKNELATVLGTYGKTSAINEQWTNYDVAQCFDYLRVYCIESFKL